jgi:hypothetical protein
LPLLLTFTINSFCEKSDLRDAIWKGNYDILGLNRDIETGMLK